MMKKDLVAVTVPALMLDGYLSINAAAKVKGVSHEGLRQAIARGVVQAIVVNARLTLVHRDELAKYRPAADRQRAGRAGWRARVKDQRKERRAGPKARRGR